MYLLTHSLTYFTAGYFSTFSAMKWPCLYFYLNSFFVILTYNIYCNNGSAKFIYIFLKRLNIICLFNLLFYFYIYISCIYIYKIREIDILYFFPHFHCFLLLSLLLFIYYYLYTTIQQEGNLFDR